MMRGPQHYPELTDSGVLWASEMPDHWRTVRAKWLFTKMDRPVSQDDEVVTCFRDGTVTLRKNRRELGYTESLKEIGYQGVRRGDLVIHSMDAFAGACGVSDSDGKSTPVYSVCAPRDGAANSHYYAFCVREMARNQWILALSRGIRERSTDFRFAAFGDQLFPVPPSLEQRAIVRFLDRADRRIRRYIRAKERLIELLEEQKQVTIHQAVTGHIHVRTGQPYPAYKDSGVEWLGKVPEHWRMIRAKGLFEKVERPVRPHDKVVTCFRDGVVTLRENRRVLGFTESLKEIGYQGVRRGDLVIHAMDAFAGACGVADSDGKSTPVYAVCTPSGSGVNAYYFAFCVREMARSKWILALSRGVRKRSTDFRFAAFSSQLVPVPPYSEQSAIVRHLELRKTRFEAAVEGARQQCDLFREYRARLIADVVTGKLDVREAAVSLHETGPLSVDDPNDNLESEFTTQGGITSSAYPHP